MADRLDHDLSAALQRHADVVECAYLFGSQALGEPGPLSDVDLAVLFGDALSPEARVDIAAALAEQVQGLTDPVVDVTILNDAPPALRHRIIRDGRLLFARNESRRVAFETQAILEFLDFRLVLDSYDQALFARAREGRLGS